MTELILVRHGETVWNQERRYQGQRDSPLSPLGKEQAEKTGKFLANQEIKAIYCSDLKRALSTAQAIGAYHRLVPIVQPRLREMAFGVWEGLTREEILGRYPAIFKERCQNYLKTRIPGGELPGEVVKRMQQTLWELGPKHSNETAVLVAHGGALRLMLASLLQMPLENAHRLHLDNGSISRLLYKEDTRGGLWEILNINSTGHLQ